MNVWYLVSFVGVYSKYQGCWYVVDPFDGKIFFTAERCYTWWEALEWLLRF